MKFSNDLDDIIIIDWKKIQTENAEKAIFNNKLEELISLERDYTTFNADILKAGLQTATRKKTENKGWFHHSEQTLLPIISYSDYFLHHLRMWDHDDPLLTVQLKLSQYVVTNNIALAKAAWSLHQAEKIHEIRFNPKQAWESVKVLAGGKSSHHKAPTVMRLKLPSGKLATTDAENASIMGPHFEKVYTHHRPIDWKVLLDIEQRTTLWELDAIISWE